MITTRARCGSSAIDYLILSLHIVQEPHALLARGRPPEAPMPGSAPLVRTLHVLQEPGKVRACKATRRALEALHRPRPEIEVQRAGRVLDRPPQRPAVLAHQAEDPG